MTNEQNVTDDAVEQLGEALYALSASLRKTGFLDDADHHRRYEAVVAAFKPLATCESQIEAGEVEPLNMVLHCPVCRLQHIDEPAPEEFDDEGRAVHWTNPPHRSHLCHGCGHIWRPADVATNGVAAVKTRGSADSQPTPSCPDVSQQARELLRTEIINSPETADFMAAVPLEAAHQRERWGTDHDSGKGPQDWFWLIGYLGGKALRAAIDGATEKAKHHTISTAAALANWHAALDGASSKMRPGIEEAAPIAPTANSQGDR